MQDPAAGLVTANDLARIVGRTPTTLRSWATTRGMPFARETRRGRSVMVFDAAAVERWMRANDESVLNRGGTRAGAGRPRKADRDAERRSEPDRVASAPVDRGSTLDANALAQLQTAELAKRVRVEELLKHRLVRLKQEGELVDRAGVERAIGEMIAQMREIADRSVHRAAEQLEQVFGIDGVAVKNAVTAQLDGAMREWSDRARHLVDEDRDADA